MPIIYSELYATVVRRAEEIAWAALRTNRTLAEALSDVAAEGWNRQELFVAQTVVRTLYQQMGGRQ